MTLRVVVAALALAAAAAVAWLWLHDVRPTPRPGPGPAPAVPAPHADAEAPVAPGAAAVRPQAAPTTPPAAAPGAEPAEDAAEHDHAAVEDPTGDLALYAAHPMSPVPHHVVRGWGARGAGKLPGVVGVYVIVDPGLSDAQLARLARDVRAYHHDATALSVRILDSEEAATYDRHRDGGALAAEHLVGVVNRNEHLGLDRIEIRGREIDVSEAGTPEPAEPPR